MTRGHGTIAFFRLLLIFCAAALPAFANTIHVPQDQPTIQAGIDAASNGDTVLVAPGTYNENIDFKGKAITVTSSGGAAVTIIDGGNKPGMATVQLRSGETSASVLSHFTIRGGGDIISNDPGGAGGIFINDSSPIIQGNTVTANTCYGIVVGFGVATILDNDISDVLQSNLGTNYCSFSGGISLEGTQQYGALGSTIVGNTIENITGSSAINVWAAQNSLILNNTIRNVNSPNSGSAFTSANSTGFVIVQNLIYGNTAGCGGAIGFNDGEYGGFGAYSPTSPSILIANNTLVDNVAATQLSGDSNCIDIAQVYPGFYSYGEDGPGSYIVNNIFSGSTTYPAVNCSWDYPPSLSIQPTFQNDILSNTGGLFFGSYCVDVSGQDNNKTSDPDFVDRAGHDYHLKQGSLAIDAGENTVLQLFQAMTGQSLTTDFDGNPRVQDATAKGCTIDIGAYEYPGKVSECGTLETLTSSSPTSAAGQSVMFTAQLSSSSGTPTGSVQFLDNGNPLSTQPVSGGGSSTYSTSALTVGSHTIAANYQPTGSFAAATASVTQVVTGYATSTALTCEPNSISVGATALLTASVASTNGTPTGTIAFTDNGAALSTQNLLNGSASLTYTGSSAATHTILATYNPAGNFAGSSASCSVVVAALPSKSSLAVSPTSANAGATVTLTANVFPPGPNNSLPTGTVTFTNAGATIGVGTLVSGVAALSLDNLPAGTDSLSCSYSGDSVYAPSACNVVPVTIVGNATTLTLASSLNPAEAFQPIALTAHLSSSTTSAVPAGSIVFLSNGTPLGTSQIGPGGIAALTVNFPVGTDSLTATFAATSAFDAATSSAVMETVTADATATALAVSPNPAAQNTVVTLNAQVAPAFGQSLPTGSIAFFDGATKLAIVPVDSNGHATFTSSAFAVGSHTLTAAYSGSPSDLASTSPAQTLVVNLRDFTLAAPPSLTIETGYHARLNLTLVSVGSFADSVYLSCSNLPEWASCHFADTLPALTANQTVATSIDIQTDAIYDYKSELRMPLALRTGIAIALLAPLGMLASPRRRKLLRLSMLLPTVILGASLLAVSGCSGLYPPSVAPGTYTIKITGQGANTGLTHTATFHLIVTP